MKRIIFGGSFDPIHFGHLKMAERAKDFVNADIVEFVIAPTSRWKKYYAASNHRLEMTNLMVTNLTWARVSALEIERNAEVNYTFDTLIEYKEKYPADELFLLIGGDQAVLFPKWHKAKEISKLAKILVYERLPEYVIDKNIINEYNMTIINGESLPYSSTSIRNLENLGTKEEVIDYITSNDLYFMEKIDKYISNKRRSHSLEVAKLARTIAKANNLDEEKAFICGLLHDIGKEVKEDKAKAIMNEHYTQYAHLYRWLHHQFIGEYIAKNDFNISDPSMLRAIEFHATGIDNMDWLGMVIYSSDKIEPTRGFDSSSLIMPP